MNEQVKMLAQQARQHYLTLNTGYAPEQVGMYPQLMEKFAELIILECASICEQNEYYNKWSSASEWAMKGASAFKKHFGVE